MKKFSLVNVSEDFGFVFREDDVIMFEMPSFCSGDYKAVVKADKDFGLYIDDDDNYFEGCRNFIVTRNGKEV